MRAFNQYKNLTVFKNFIIRDIAKIFYYTYKHMRIIKNVLNM